MLIPIVKGDDETDPVDYKTELSWSIGNNASLWVSFWTKRHVGYPIYDLQCIAVAGGGAVLAAETAYVDVHL